MDHPNLTIPVIDAVILATIEAASNVMKHAYADVTDRTMLIRIVQQDETLSIEILHHGDRSVPDQPADPDFSGLSEDGFGLFIIHELMDTVTYSRTAPNWQSILLIKKLV